MVETKRKKVGEKREGFGEYMVPGSGGGGKACLIFCVRTLENSSHYEGKGSRERGHLYHLKLGKGSGILHLCWVHGDPSPRPPQNITQITEHATVGGRRRRVANPSNGTSLSTTTLPLWLIDWPDIYGDSCAVVVLGMCRRVRSWLYIECFFWLRSAGWVSRATVNVS